MALFLTMSAFKFCPTGGRIVSPKVWLIDMDDTLYSASARMFHDIHILMDAYIVQKLGLTAKEANNLRKEYWRRYGVTYYGLWLNHGIDPHDFLTQTHLVDTSSIHTQGRMREAIMSLQGKKILFTNAPDRFADQILKKLHLSDCFDAQYRAENMKVFGQWRPKPSAQMLRKVLAEHHVSAHHCCLIDDSLNNLKIAKSVGIQTVLCKGWHHYGIEAVRPCSYIDACVAHIRDVKKILVSSKKPSPKSKRPKFLNPYN